MKDQLISFETAKLAKEKGCDEPCELRYNEYKEVISTKLGMHGHPNRYSGSYAAYTQSLLQKWLREKYDIHITIRKHKSLNMQKSFWKSFIEVEKKNRFIHTQWSNSVATYEEALEQGLEALKLILRPEESKDDDYEESVDIQTYITKYPNDADLGNAIRQLFKFKSIPKNSPCTTCAVPDLSYCTNCSIKDK